MKDYCVPVRTPWSRRAQYLDLVAERLDQASRTYLQARERSFPSMRAACAARPRSGGERPTAFDAGRTAAGRLRRALQRGGEQVIRIEGRFAGTDPAHPGPPERKPEPDSVSYEGS